MNAELTVNSWCGISIECQWDEPCDVHRFIAALTEARESHRIADEIAHRALDDRDDARDALDRVRAIRAEDHATTSRDYGRGFAEALRMVERAIEGES